MAEAIDPGDRAAVLAAVGTFRRGAEILAEDVRLACGVDGHPIKHLSRMALVRIMRERCDPVPGPYGRRDNYGWIRRW